MKSDSVNIPINALAWCNDAEKACSHSFTTTGAGELLTTAIAIIRQQHAEIQRARNGPQSGSSLPGRGL